MSDEIKNGRPRVYNTVDEMEAIIEEYFDHCDNRIQHVYSKKQDAVIEIINPAPYTMAGLARRIGLSRQGLLDYKKRTDDNGQDFLDAIKRARDRVQEDVETRLMEGQPAGAIFNLKNNFEYRDKTEQENTGTINVVTRKHTSRAAKRAGESTNDQQDD